MEYMSNFWNFGKWPSWFSSRASRPMGLFFYFSLIWDDMGEKFQTISPLKVHNRFTPKCPCILPVGGWVWGVGFGGGGGVSTKVAQRTVQFEISDFCKFFFFIFANMRPYDESKVSNYISSESAHQIHSAKFMYTPRLGFYPNC